MAYRSSVHHLGLLDASSGETDVLSWVSLCNPITNRANIRQHSVIINMVPIVTRGVGEDQSLQPLDTPASDLTWYHSSQGTAVVRPEILSVHLVRKHDSSVRVHGPVQLDGCSIVAVRLHRLASAMPRDSNLNLPAYPHPPCTGT